MATGYRNAMTVPTLALASSRRRSEVPTRDTGRESSLASSRYTNQSNSRQLTEMPAPTTMPFNKTINNKLYLNGMLGQLSLGTIESNLTFCNQNLNRISCNPYLQENDQPNAQKIPNNKSSQVRQSSLSRLPKYPDSEKTRIFQPNLLTTEYSSHISIEQEIKNKQLARQLEATEATFKSRLKTILDDIDSFHNALQEKYEQLPRPSKQCETTLRQLTLIRSETVELNRSFMVEIGRLCIT